MPKTASGLIEYARAQLGRPYWMGTFGQAANENLYKYNKERLPQYYTASDFPTQYRQRVHDCIGLIKGYLWSDTPESAPVYRAEPCRIDHSADNIFAYCTELGTMPDMPETPGILVGFAGHIGVYVGGGKVIEARGHSYGVVETALTARPWTRWGKCPYISYEEDKEVSEPVYNTIEEVPDWGRETIQKLFDKGYLIGESDTALGIKYTMLRTLVINDRAGLYN